MISILNMLLILVLCLSLIMNYIWKSSIQTFFINLILFTESLTLIFFFGKISIEITLPILLTSFFFLIRSFEIHSFLENEKEPFFVKNEYLFRYVGMGLCLLVVVTELFSDFYFTSNDFMLFFLGTTLLFYHKIPKRFSFEKKFLVLFFFFIAIFFVFPDITYKFLKYIDFYEDSDSFIQNNFIHYFLGIPLYNILSILGYNVILDGNFISYQDLPSHTFQKLEIASSCSGHDSVKVFLSALLSIILVYKRKVDHSTLIVLFLGLFLSYIANLFRMVVIIIVGHHYGLDSLLYVHANIGWIIFSAWLFIFLLIIEYLGIIKYDK